MKILLDEDLQSRRLARLLREAGHDVDTVNEAGLAGSPDEVVFAHAKRTDRTVLTRNASDFNALHQADTNHSSILIEHIDVQFSKRMSREDVVAVIGNVEAAGLDIHGLVMSLNSWQR